MLEVQLQIENPESPLDPVEFSQFIITFKTLITALANIETLPKLDDKFVPDLIEIGEIKNKLQSISIGKLENYIIETNDVDSLQFNSITFNSPLKFACICWGSLFTIAIIFGGGQVEFSLSPTEKLEFKGTLPSLGEALKKFNEALSLDKNVRIGYGVTNTIIILDDKEYRLLMKQKVETKKKGGFQRFLVGLQYRIDHKTKELELNKSDIEQIYRYKKNPQKGGFQLRCEKIFGRHFPERSAK